MKIMKFFSKIREYLKDDLHTYTPSLRIVEIFQDQHKDYFVVVQTIGKSITFKMKPEKILANDKLTNQFTPVDIRSLTYLGYLGINSPQYKVLAERFSEDGNALFAVVKKGEKEAVVKTAAEVLADKKILTRLDKEDISRISFFAASETNVSTRSISQETDSKIENDN
jgi:hypothetical protein